MRQDGWPVGVCQKSSYTIDYVRASGGCALAKVDRLGRQLLKLEDDFASEQRLRKKFHNQIQAPQRPIPQTMRRAELRVSESKFPEKLPRDYGSPPLSDQESA